ncbi:MAG: aldehyde dehydrogenase family protein [Elusimicrobia bacterium]|nr:aldehyde dehydrogenase family protein [Elusimicrobiota bacterium]
MQAVMERKQEAVVADDLSALFEKQRANRWNVARTTAWERAGKLSRLGKAIERRRAELHQALVSDFHKNPAETDITEIFTVLSEINHTVRHLEEWMRPVRVKTPMALFGTKSEIRHEPKGQVLILAPWNYPFSLALSPLVAAVAAGNCVTLRPSGKVPATARFIKSLLAEVFSPDEVAVVEGGHEVSDALLQMPFDHIFFTGSTNIGKRVMAAAAKHLATVTLELGGKSPVVIDETADIPTAAKRIMWAKFLNAGQTCVAPDYVLVHESKAEEFIEESKKVVAARYGAGEEERRASSDYCRIISKESCRSLASMVEESVRQGAKVVMGGQASENERYLSPTIVTGVDKDSALMRDEIFGPVLPVLTWRSLEEPLRIIRERAKPLALYLFSRSKDNVERVLSGTTAGGSCVNHAIIHLANPNLPFGGVGASGMGHYHGYYGFKTFSHARSVLYQGALNDPLNFFYPPYTPKVRKLVELALKYLT